MFQAEEDAELAALNAEAEMPLEELLAMYGRSSAIAPQPLASEDDKMAANPPAGEVAIVLDQTDALPLLNGRKSHLQNKECNSLNESKGGCSGEDDVSAPPGMSAATTSLKDVAAIPEGRDEEETARAERQESAGLAGLSAPADDVKGTLFAARLSKNMRGSRLVMLIVTALRGSRQKRLQLPQLW